MRGAYEAWMKRAACDGHDPELWFPDQGEPSVEARKVCAECQVRLLCLDYAIRNREEHGIWGGLGVRERRNLRKKIAV